MLISYSNIFLSFHFFSYIYINKTIKMAIQIQTYWKTTELSTEQLQSAIRSCKGQDYKLLYLFKTYGTLTTDDAYVLYNQLNGPIKESSLGRSRNTLEKNGVIYPTGNVPGPYNVPVTLYTIIDNPPTKLKTFNNSIPKSITIELVFDEEGKIDLDKMFDLTTEKLDFIIKKYNI